MTFEFTLFSGFLSNELNMILTWNFFLGIIDSSTRFHHTFFVQFLNFGFLKTKICSRSKFWIFLMLNCKVFIIRIQINVNFVKSVAFFTKSNILNRTFHHFIEIIFFHSERDFLLAELHLYRRLCLCCYHRKRFVVAWVMLHDHSKKLQT